MPGNDDCPASGITQQNVFDIHVHLWNGDRSYNEYVSQLDSTRQPMTRFGGILIAKERRTDTYQRKK